MHQEVLGRCWEYGGRGLGVADLHPTGLFQHLGSLLLFPSSHVLLLRGRTMLGGGDVFVSMIAGFGINSQILQNRGNLPPSHADSTDVAGLG